jgi:hypothetical protein
VSEEPWALVEAERFDSPLKARAVDPIAISDYEPGGRLPRERLDHLLCGPLGGCNPELEKFAVNSRRAPGGIGPVHLKDELSDFVGDRRGWTRARA